MKAKILSALLLLAATVFSCTPSELIQPDGSSEEKQDVRVTLSVMEQSPATKSSFSATESNIWKTRARVTPRAAEALTPDNFYN